MIKRVLIACCGEVSTRIARACRRTGLHSIALTPEEGVGHADAADEIVEANATHDPAELAKIVADVKADAIHLGYAEMQDAALARELEGLGLTCIGTAPDIVELVGNAALLEKVVSEASLKYGPNPSARAREVSVLVAADAHGEVTPICDVDRSLAPLILESPSPEFIFRPDGDALQAAALEAASRLALGLRSPGLMHVHFAIEPGGRMFVQGVTLGLPRQHTLYEMVTGLDLGALQLDIAQGKPLPDELSQVQTRGHAIATSLFVTGAPTSRAVEELFVPPTSHSRFRAEPSATTGTLISDEDGSLMLKLTCFEAIRHRALLAMDRTLAETRISPFSTNVETLRDVLGHFSFRAGEYDRSSILDEAARHVA